MAVHLVGSDDVLPRALQILARERSRAAGLAPAGVLSLTGGSSIPGLLTRGDVDLHLRVPAADFGAVVERLRSAWDVANPDIWTTEFASFVVPGASPPTGVAVTAIGGEHDRRFVSGWRRLAGDPELVGALNELKRRHAAGSEADYEAAKSAFFSEIEAR